ncbi:MAG: outer membrane protein assembly factor BamA [Pseudomonadota bacterium]
MKSLLISLCILLLSPASLLAAVYTIDDIRIEGLQRVSPSIVFSAINITANSEITDTQLQTAIKDLFATGFFDNVTVGRDQGVLIITVDERPVVGGIAIEGNKVIEEEPLLEGLKSIGLAEGEVFKPSALESISKQLSAQYSALGRYSAEIETITKPIDGNQILVGIRINEGNVAKIKHINIVGNTQFDEDELRDLFSLNTTGMWSWLSGNDKYARERLAGDIERLKSYYLDRGYLRLEVTSTQVSLSPDKETVFITVNIDEGQQYTVDNINIAGDPILPEEELFDLIELQQGDVFSQLSVTNTEQAIQRSLSNEGYSAAQVSGVPEFGDNQKTVSLTFYIKPGSISYVRRIRFTGNTNTADHVLRREMRQLEGAPVSAEKLEQSRVRLQRLGLFGEVSLNTREVPGTNDQVDIEFTVTEQPTASVDLSLGYSGDGGVSIGAGLQHNNWLGSGNTFGVNVDRSESETNYSLNFNNPYYTPDGVSRGIRFFYRERDFDDISVANFATDTYGVTVNFGYPISETGRLSLGLGYENVSVEPGTTTAQEIQGTPTLRGGRVEDFYIQGDDVTDIINALTEDGTRDADTNNNNLFDEDDSLSGINRDTLELGVTSLNDTSVFTPVDDAVLDDRPEGFLDKYGDTFDTFKLDFGWSNSTLNRGIFPTSGLSQRLNLEVAVPGSDVEFYKLTYRGNLYLPIASSSALRVRTRVGFGESYGDTDVLPFFENFFSGGITSVRGFEPSSLGPKATPSNAFVAVPVDLDLSGDSDIEYVYVLDQDTGQLASVADDDVDTFGGNLLFELSMELMFPMPFIKSSDKVRTSLFVDSGNVFSTDCGELQQNCGNLDLGKLSVAAGLGIQWLSPIGPLGFSFATPLVEQPFDEPETFQFTLGRTF